MKIEEIKPSHYGINECRIDDKVEEKIPKKKKLEDAGKKQIGSYWFPLSEGYKRLSFVLWIVSSTIVAGVTTEWDSDDFVGVFFFIISVEFVSYLAIIWVYQGFKEANDEKKI